MKSFFDELRLLVCIWLFKTILYLAPKKNELGMLMVEAIYDFYTKKIMFHFRQIFFLGW